MTRIEPGATYLTETGRKVRAVTCRYDGQWDCNVWIKSRNDWTKATTIFDLTKATQAEC